MTLSMRWPSHGTAKVLVVVGSISRQLHWPQGKYLAALQGVFRVFSVLLCFFPIFFWKWRNGHVVNPIRNHPQHHHFSGLKSSPVMVGLWIPHDVLKLAELKPKNSFLIAICCKKKLGVGLRFQAPWELMSQTGPTQMGLLWYVWWWPQSLAKMVQITTVVQLGFRVIITYRDYGYVQ